MDLPPSCTNDSTRIFRIFRYSRDHNDEVETSLTRRARSGIPPSLVPCLLFLLILDIS